jgi:hypothetical protein
LYQVFYGSLHVSYHFVFLNNKLCLMYGIIILYWNHLYYDLFYTILIFVSIETKGSFWNVLGPGLYAWTSFGVLIFASLLHKRWHIIVCHRFHNILRLFYIQLLLFYTYSFFIWVHNNVSISYSLIKCLFCKMYIFCLVFKYLAHL